MIDSKSIFANTVLHQDTYELVTPESIEEWKGAYTPWKISSWDYPKSTVVPFDRKNMFLHEFSHAIDMWLSGKEKKLLLRNFGFGFGKLTWKYFRTECRVLSIQRLLCEHVFGYNPLDEETRAYIFKQFTHKERGVKCTREEFDSELDETYLLFNEVGVDEFLDAWIELCAFVKNNREEDLLHLIGL